jgi:A/G-specific adenine glycosylase
LKADRLKSVRSGLLRWYRRNARDLPWRSTTDPYAIWVSEIMLQQTQVATVIPYYTRFLERFPTIAALAAAGEEEVLAAWSGLGYYRRARSLLAGAREMVRVHGGVVPMEVGELMAIPGIGRYTAGAVASIAFHQPQPVLDGNIRRVLSRLTAGRIRGETGSHRLHAIGS